MTTRCKFRCNSIATRADLKPIHSATFTPVISGSDENKSFFAFTPGGELKLDVMNTQHFEAGKEYYLDITLAEAADSTN